MRSLPDLAVFTSTEAAQHGWTSSALRHAVRSGRLRRPRRGIYTVGDASPVVDAIAAARSVPDTAVSDRSATLLHALPLLGPRPALPELTLSPRTTGSLDRIHLYRATLRPCDVVLVGETRVTSVARTLIDLGRHRPLGTAVVAIDAALHRCLVTNAELDDVLRFCWNWPGIGRAQRAVRRSDARAESPLESISRLVIENVGLPRPEPQQVLFDQYGSFLGRGDFYWDEFGVVGEADGRSKYDERPVLTAEKDRQELLEDTGLVVARWGWNHVRGQQHVLRSRIERAFARGRYRDRSGLPRLWTL